MPKKGVQRDQFRDLCLATLRQEWSALIIVPADSAGSALPLARTLAEIGGIDLISAVGVTPDSAARVTQEMLAYHRGRVVVALEAVVSNPAGLPIALAADVALLCVTLGRTEIAAARRTIEMIGRERFIGCVTFSPR
jgi:hypothetical protein